MDTSGLVAGCLCRTAAAADGPILDALRRESALENAVPRPAVQVLMDDGTCIRIPRGWRVVSSDGAIVLERSDIGRVTISQVGSFHDMLLDLWAEHAENQTDEYGEPRMSPDCGHPYGCTVAYLRSLDGIATRCHAFQAGRTHAVELEYPADSRNGNTAIADAVFIAGNVGCPPTD